MLSQQKYIPPETTQKIKYQHQVLDNINHQNAKIKIFLFSFKHKKQKPEDEIINDSSLSKYDTKSENRKFKRQDSRILDKKTKGEKQSLIYNKLSEDDKLFKRHLMPKTHSVNDNIFKQKVNQNEKLSRSNFSNDMNIINPQQHLQKSRKKDKEDNTYNFQPNKKNSLFRVRSKYNDQMSHNLQYFQRQQPKKRKQIKQSQFFQVESIQSHRIVAHINTLVYLTFQSTAEDIFPFFESIYSILKIKQVKSPIIKRYKNCIYYGQKNLQNKGVYEGMVWYFKEIFYYGEFVEGKKHGLGIQIQFSNFDVCIWKGKFYNGQKSGYFSIESNQFKYYGLLKKGEFHGQGHLITAISQYKGNFCENIKEGIGLQKFANKSQYKGFYFNNIFDGQGQLKTSSYYYKGLFKLGKPDGYGFQRTNQYEYLGQFVMGKKQGKGKLKIMADGTIVECKFKNGLIMNENSQNVKENVQSPKQLILSDYLSKDLQALNEESQEGTLQNMLNEINKNPKNVKNPKKSKNPKIPKEQQ